MKRTWFGLLSGAVAAAGVMALVTGCDMLKKGGDEETAAEETTAAEEPPPEPEATATAEATAEADDGDAAAEPTDAGADDEDMGEVKTYPNQIPASGTYVLLKSFNVHQAADIESKKLGGVGRGTIINLKATLGEWLLVKWPSGPGEMKPGWIKVRTSQSNFIKPSEEPDAGKPVVDAGTKEEPKPKPDKEPARGMHKSKLPQFKKKLQIKRP
ncbi:MAG: hypothetical protein JRI23_00840 [Deltaproteobacteria bacterium]|jgi:hypothetical protein|nr:hypothetical protein [Deltaproteobacteria bacterium]MBW2529999.1 hypothetical protein [Deltaproteobacteria bacterium]